jgi:transcription elongation factor Elf1
MVDLSRKWNWHNKYKTVIRCPRCNARHYSTRIDRKHLNDNGYYDVDCGCGYGYRIKDTNGSSLVISGRRYDNGK